MKRLSPAQIHGLRLLGSRGSSGCWSTGRNGGPDGDNPAFIASGTAASLARLGLARYVDGRSAEPRRYVFVITDAGRQLLTELAAAGPVRSDA